MFIKKVLTLVLLIIPMSIFSQQSYNFGVITSQEKEMVIYEKDTTANAVILHEEGNTVFFEKNDYIQIRTTIYRKIKILKKEGVRNANVCIGLSNNKNKREYVKKVRGITHNKDGTTTSLDKKNVFTKKVSDRYTEITFAIPNVTEGSVIEYMYVLESPFIFNFTGWDFQGSIPTKKSIFKAKIPGNYKYNRKLIGFGKLSKNEASIEKRCFRVRGVSGTADCEVLTYEMRDIPAFIEEDYMTSKKNYLSRISFELSELNWFDGTITKYTKSWKDVDKEYRTDKEIGGQLRKKGFFKKKVPTNILSISDELKRAKKIFSFIQDHYTWNKKYRIFSDINVTKAFNEKVGNISEINLSLINALRVGKIKAELVLLSTRNNGFLTKIHPIISEFNYVVAKVTIGNTSYFLDATDKSLPFGVLPFKCLNKDVRVMDFKNGSYWDVITPIKNNGKKIQMLLDLNIDGDFKGSMRIVHNGYDAIRKRKELNEISEEKYLANYEDRNDFLEIISYENFDLENREKPLKEEYEIIIENESTVANNIYLNPFFINHIEENPFKLEKRLYPVDFGYTKKKDYIVVINIPDNYTIEYLPKNKIIKLPKNKGHFIYKISATKTKITLNASFSINEIEFNSSNYPYIKELFKQAIIAQNEVIILKKK